ncbi:MAG: SPFH domain-containing protein [Phycisphaerales bacterium]
MRGDYLTYRRAAGVSFLGLAIQGALALGMLIYGRLGSDHAAVTAAIFMGLGLIVWVGLAILYDQHRRERIEAMEAEALASEAGASSAFEQSDDLRVAARRVQTVQKWVLSALAVIVAAALITIGVIRWRAGRALIPHDAFGEAALPGWGIAVGLGVAFVGFVFARFVSGMGKQPAWSALRAGAAQAVGSALLGLAVAVANFVDIAIGPDTLNRYLPATFGIVLIVLGAEIAINFLLDLYRPRQPGQSLRPAFDSRLLGLLAAPDKIAESAGEALSYQFGVDVTGSWFYRLLSRWVLALVVLGIVVGWGLTMFVVVEPHQRALILTNGKISKPLLSLGETGENDVGPGLHVKWPWPFGQVLVPEFTTRDASGNMVVSRTTTGVRTLQLGANPPTPGTGPLLWTEEHSPNEMVSIVQPSLVGSGDEEARARDLALVVAEVPMQFVVRDLELYERLAGPGEREDVLQNVGRRVVMRRLSSMRIDAVLAGGRTELADALRADLVEAYAQLNAGEGAGIEIVFVGAGGVHPPKGVAANFERLIQARQNVEGMLETARMNEIESLTGVAGSVDLARQIIAQLDEMDRLTESGRADEQDLIDRNLEVQRLLEQAGGDAGERLIKAGAERWKRHMGERAKATRFEAQVASYEAAPALYRTKQYFEALLDAMKGSRVYINDIPEAKIWLNLEERQGTLTDLDFSTGQQQ